MVSRNRTSRRYGVALVITLMLVVLLVSVTARLATTGAVESIRAVRRGNDLQHRLAMESMLRHVAEQFEVDSDFAKEFDRRGEALAELELADVHIECRVVNDGAKLDVAAFCEDGYSAKLARKLRRLQHSLDIPATRVRLRPATVPANRKSRLPRYVWYDQLFEGADSAGCFRFNADAAAVSPETVGRMVWSDVVTFFGDGRVDVRHARHEVLAVLLEDIDRGAAESIRAQREQIGSPNWLDSILSESDETNQNEIKRRICIGCNRKALTITTAVNADCRQWYVVADISAGKIGTVYYQGRIQW